MSSILKALKKLEDAKAIRPPGSHNIGADILADETRRSFSLVGITLVSALLFICGSGVTYFYMKRATTAIPYGRAPVPVAAAPVIIAQPQPPTNSTRILIPAVAVTRPHAVPLSPPVQSGGHATARSDRQTPTPKTGLQAVPLPAVQATPTVTLPVIKVNGIAFQGDGGGNVAVVNGVPVANGSVVEGARVEDIQRDRVRFSLGGEKFEVGLGKSNR